MSNTMNTKNFESEIMAQLAEIRAILSNTNSSPSMKEKKPRKPKNPDAPKSDWIVFTGKVRAALKEAELPAGKEAQQFASHLKTEFPDAYNMDESEMLAAHKGWTPKPKEEKKEDQEEEKKGKKGKKEEKTAATEVPKPKPVRKPLSEEHKAKLAAGRKAAAEKKKTESGAK